MANSILELIKQNKEYNSKNSVQWFQRQIKSIIGKDQLSSTDMLRQNQGNLTTRILPGRMYMFVYDPKGKDSLPFYDKFPLVIPFSKEQGHFRGLNFHYLPYSQRIILLDALIRVGQKSTMKNMNEELRLSWQIVRSAAKMKIAAPCVKMYLNGHVKTRFVEIPKDDWATAIMLPTHSFVGSSANKVWTKSITG